MKELFELSVILYLVFAFLGWAFGIGMVFYWFIRGEKVFDDFIRFKKWISHERR